MSERREANDPNDPFLLSRTLDSSPAYDQEQKQLSPTLLMLNQPCAVIEGRDMDRKWIHEKSYDQHVNEGGKANLRFTPLIFTRRASSSQKTGRMSSLTPAAI